jgi:hypothetical protein
MAWTSVEEVVTTEAVKEHSSSIVTAWTSMEEVVTTETWKGHSILSLYSVFNYASNQILMVNLITTLVSSNSSISPYYKTSNLL